MNQIKEAASDSTAFAAIVVAAGQGLRAGQRLPKQFANWRGKPLLRHSIERLIASGASPIIVVIPPDGEDIARQALSGLADLRFVPGGALRQQSVAAGLEALADDSPGKVLIHDAARPDLPVEVIEALLAALDRHDGVIPVLPVVDSLVITMGGMMWGTADRETVRRVQTPQAFRYGPILAAHRAAPADLGAGDDAQILQAAGGEIALVAGDERLKKITFAEDFSDGLPPLRVGSGYDVHRLAEGEELWLGGIRIPHTHGLAGHSDADVAIHAIVDALLGAVAEGDIGSHFPPSDPQWKGASSDRFLQHAVRLVAEAGYSVGNIDLTIICEAPKIGPHRSAIRSRLAGLLEVPEDRVSVKATTTERLGFTGREEGMAAQATATVVLG
ncbi:bifunctional 2-C-methyl-D-erythritol 4-phosphate cytidylyltransferase/2-C-methyl-D-erythritol 2,4-cyclodiphosphate synthase [Altererythrobacter sp. SALINAS58]|uniref:bifunctional 2-C-methyl-D-erythritol 4-phosphate cytidylyltransferase/2-C-methyl-D-erythritol 2,4-cyclodiphosphate synthase n=1 Tax=Alteripontixanthobacter muriae TaxID=2705546 RepID=UPI0015766035|nr:bifunctional 2-C-methyl-D-erythritol 4-phosphate cytidylyltransferase/2-C-methyl-D-erythritol 2,4-cyclodiphosphate synthase [Alteripontixanthobacter muriae]NTZ41659.1 bifunctional 2-C-methyl-D-erythritol 4-phosphate cytidylyltransferase/2-C-methyl-D-erythritol 2,4-cyclodiphosphate synthase [Alteripontixanthobacter muriae]